MIHLETLQSDWLRGFWPISQEQDFFQRICAGTQQIKMFHIELTQLKLMTKFFFKFKKPYFWPFPLFLGQKKFSMKSSCYAQLLKGFWHHAKIQRNLMIQFQENTQTDARRQRWTDYFIGSFQLPPRV